jgi:hypothetical protein
MFINSSENKKEGQHPLVANLKDELYSLRTNYGSDLTLTDESDTGEADGRRKGGHFNLCIISLKLS